MKLKLRKMLSYTISMIIVASIAVVFFEVFTVHYASIVIGLLIAKAIELFYIEK